MLLAHRGTGVMDNSGMLRGLLCLGLVAVLCHGQTSQEVSSEDFGVDRSDVGAERDFIEAMERILGKMHDRVSPPEKRGIQMCGMGDRCAMKFGPRIGKLCDCGRGANCNSYLLKCI